MIVLQDEEGARGAKLWIHGADRFNMGRNMIRHALMIHRTYRLNAQHLA